LQSLRDDLRRNVKTAIIDLPKHRPPVQMWQVFDKDGSLAARVKERGFQRVVRQHAMGDVVIVQGHSQLFQMVPALSTARGFPGLLYRREQKRNEYTDDGDDHQEFNESESS
jgi:hypothetical protein